MRLSQFIVITLACLTPPTIAAAQDAGARAPVPAFVVSEAEAGDLNGDGDALDSVLHVFDAKRRTTFNLGIAASTVCRSAQGPPFVVCTPVPPVAGKTIVAFLAGESAQGGTDLNADGDAVDDVLYIYDAGTGATTNTRLAVGHGVGRDLSSYTFPLIPVVAGDGVAVLVGEGEQGGTDLNFDADAADDVLHLIDARARQTLNLELAAATIPGPFGAQNPIPLQVDGPHVTFVAGESEQGGVDLNEDGDTADQVSYRLKAQNGKLRPAI